MAERIATTTRGAAPASGPAKPAAAKAPPPKGGEQQIKELLDRLDRQTRKAEALGGAPKRERPEVYRRSGITISVEHPGGGTTRLSAHSRHLWCEGIELVSAGFTYPGSACTVTLVTQSGDSMLMPGRVTVCRHIEATWHEMEVKFNQRIDPHLYVEHQRNGQADAAEEVDLPNLRGRVLYLDDSELDQRLLAHQIRGSGIELKAVKTGDEAVACLRGSMYDILLCDLNLGGGQDGIEVVRMARGAGFDGPIVMLTAETSPAKLATAKAAGANHFLAKPYQRATLLQLMTKLHKAVGAVTTGDVLYSTLDDQPDMEELVSEYVAEAKQLAEKIQAAMLARDFDLVRELCLNIKGSAVGYGFAPLGLAAEEAQRALDSTMSLEEARPQLRMLTLTCCHLGLRRTAAPAPATAAGTARPATRPGGGAARTTDR